MRPAVCATCGATDVRVAMISDPFLDHCYYVCADCMAPLHAKFGEQVRKAFAARVPGTSGQ